MKKTERAIRAFESKKDLALSFFTAILMGRKNEYKTATGGANFYPSDCLFSWNYHCINASGARVDEPHNDPESVVGIVAGGMATGNNPVRVLTIFFDTI